VDTIKCEKEIGENSFLCGPTAIREHFPADRHLFAFPALSFFWLFREKRREYLLTRDPKASLFVILHLKRLLYYPIFLYQSLSDIIHFVSIVEIGERIKNNIVYLFHLIFSGFRWDSIFRLVFKMGDSRKNFQFEFHRGIYNLFICTDKTRN